MDNAKWRGIKQYKAITTQAVTIRALFRHIQTGINTQSFPAQTLLSQSSVNPPPLQLQSHTNSWIQTQQVLIGPLIWTVTPLCSPSKSRRNVNTPNEATQITKLPRWPQLVFTFGDNRPITWPTQHQHYTTASIFPRSQTTNAPDPTAPLITPSLPI